jgi:hypothetical protein
MQFTILLSLAASAAAQAHIAARQTDATASFPGNIGCATAALGLISSLPTPPPAIVSDAITNPQTNPCSFTPPSSLSSAYSVYSSELLSWASANEGELASVISECPEISSYASMVPICSTAVEGALGSALGGSTSGASAAESTGTSGGSSGTESSSAPTGSSTGAGGDSGASRQGGAAAVALAVAGAVAAVL